uniref:Nuclear receptor binding protein 2 n=1 Tax=Xiphophorus couchianus TaxID=32473 RepID=A0A3B5M4M2_9TELE
ICALEMAVLEIQANGDSAVSKEAIVNAGQSLEDPLMREFTQSCLRHDANLRPTAHDLLFHRVLFEVHSLKLLAAHCLINNQYLLPENCVEEKTKSFDPNAVMAEIRHDDRPGVQLKYSHVSPLELDKFLEDVKNGIYPLMNFATSRPHPVPRALSLSQELIYRTVHSFYSRFAEILPMKLSADTPKDLASELVHYAFINEVHGKFSLHLFYIYMHVTLDCSKKMVQSIQICSGGFLFCFVFLSCHSQMF